MDSLSFHMQVLWRGVSKAVERHATDGVPLNQPERAWILVAASPSFASWSGSYRRRSPRFRSVNGSKAPWRLSSSAWLGPPGECNTELEQGVPTPMSSLQNNCLVCKNWREFRGSGIVLGFSAWSDDSGKLGDPCVVQYDTDDAPWDQVPANGISHVTKYLPHSGMSARTSQEPAETSPG